MGIGEPDFFPFASLSAFIIDVTTSGSGCHHYSFWPPFGLVGESDAFSWKRIEVNSCFLSLPSDFATSGMSRMTE